MHVWCSCTAFLRVAPATSASGACAIALGGFPYRKNVSASMPCITRTKMAAEWRSSPPPDSSAVAFADSLLLASSPNDEGLGQKRGRLVAETLLPNDSLVGCSVPSLYVNPCPAIAVHRDNRSVVEESCFVPASQPASQQPPHEDAESGSSENESGDDSISKADEGSGNSNKWEAGMGIWICFFSSLSTPLNYVCSCTR